MEAFSFLKFWRNAGTDGGADVDTTTSTSSDNPRNQALETDDDEDSFFELVFTASDCNNKVEEKSFKFVDSRKDVFFNGRVFPIEPSSNSKIPQSPISLLKSPPKFRVFMLGFKKSKSEKMKTNDALMAKSKHYSEQRKGFTLKCKVEEVPIVSLFTRDNSLRSKLDGESLEDVSSFDLSKRYGVRKYLKLIKPLYVKVSKRYNQSSSAMTPLASPATTSVCSPRKQVEKQGNFPVGLRGVCRHLGKSKSSSSAVVIMPSPTSRRDDSLLQQNDGIQSAILHCKRSYSSSSKDCSVLARSASESSSQKSINPPRDSIDEQKRISI